MGPLADSIYRNDASVAESRKLRLQELWLPTIAFCLTFVQKETALSGGCHLRIELFWNEEIDADAYKTLGDRRTRLDRCWNLLVDGR